MRLNRTQFRILVLIAQRIRVTSRQVSQSLGLTFSLASTYLNHLQKGGFLQKDGKMFIVSSNKFARILSNILMDDPTMADALCNEGTGILIRVIDKENTTIPYLSKDMGIGVSSLYPYIRRFLKRQILYKKNKCFLFNKNLWHNLYQFLTTYKSYYVLSRFNKVPNNAKIYYESLYEIIFSLTEPIDFALKTAFSEYDGYGIKLLEKEIFYRLEGLPRKELSIQTIFLDSLRVAGAKNEESPRRRLYCYLFYKKNINNLRKIRHPDLDILKEIIEGKINHKNFPNFPSKNEIIERCKEYDIKI